MKSIPTLLILTACALTGCVRVDVDSETDSEFLSRQLPAAEAQENKEFAVRVRKAAQECAQVLVEGGPYQGSALNAQDKAELCDILNRVQPVQYYHLCSVTREWLAIRFKAADGSELMTLSIYDFGNPHTLTFSTKIWLCKADEKRLFEILKWN